MPERKQPVGTSTGKWVSQRGSGHPLDGDLPPAIYVPSLTESSHSYRFDLEECLPHDVLQAIMGRMDRETLCTARLVSKTCCAAASPHVCSLTLASTTKAVSFHRLSHLEHVTVRHAYPEDLLNEETSLAQMDQCLRDLAAALTIGEQYCEPSIAQTRDFLSQAALMPKLRKLEVKGHMEHETELLARCTNLEAIRVTNCSESVLRALITLTGLTSLHCGFVFQDVGIEHYPNIPCLGLATNLQTLDICTSSENLPHIGNLTGLTGLTLYVPYEDAISSIVPLTRLTRLRSVCLDWDMTESNLAIAYSLGSGALVNLTLGVRAEVPADCGRLLSRQTALTQLGLRTRQLCNLRHIKALHVELLQSLQASALDDVDGEGLSVLSRATGLTRLSISSSMTEPDLSLSPVLGRLTQLRSLRLMSKKVGFTNFLDFPLALSPLTGLSELEICRHVSDNGVMRALLVLTGLRVLELQECRLTPDELPELGRLTDLSALRAYHCGVTSLAPVSEVLDPLRKARGLPPLHTSGYDR